MRFIQVLFLILSFIFLFRVTRPYKIIPLPFIFFSFYTIMIYMGSVDIVNEYGMNLKYIVAVTAGLFLFPLGIWIANKFYKFNPSKSIKTYFACPLIDDLKGILSVPLFWELLLFSIAISILYLIQLPSIPIFTLIEYPGEFHIIAESRLMAEVEFKYAYWYTLFFQFILPFLSIIAFVKTATHRNKFWRKMSILLIGFCIFMYISYLLKGLVLIYILALVISYGYCREGLKLRRMLFYFLGAIVYIGIIYAVWTGSYTRGTSILEKLAEVYKAPYERITKTQSLCLFYIFEEFPDNHPFLKGASIKPVGFLPYKHFDLNRYVFRLVHPQVPWEGGGPTVFFGEIYANFGFLAALLSIIVIGFVLQTIQIYFLGKPRTVLNIAFLSFFSIFSYRLAIGPFSWFISKPVIFVTIIYMCLKFSCKLYLGNGQGYRPTQNPRFPYKKPHKCAIIKQF